MSSRRVGIGIKRGVALGALLALAVAPAARAETKVASVVCGASQLQLLREKGLTAEVRAQLVTPTGRWQFTAQVGLARAGKRSRTLAVEEPKLEPGNAATGYKVMPSQLFIDLLVDDKKLSIRHASEGAPDPEVALSFAGCKVAAELDASIAALVTPPEPVGCDPAILRGAYAAQLAPLKLPAAEADREARALCEDHQRTIAARAALEQRLSDAAAQQRSTARGKAIRRGEEARLKAWEGIDACLAKAAAQPPVAVAKLRAAEEHARTCYDRAAIPK